jgi:hypothetical protein
MICKRPPTPTEAKLERVWFNPSFMRAWVWREVKRELTAAGGPSIAPFKTEVVSPWRAGFRFSFSRIFWEVGLMAQGKSVFIPCSRSPGGARRLVIPLNVARLEAPSVKEGARNDSAWKSPLVKAPSAKGSPERKVVIPARTPVMVDATVDRMPPIVDRIE